MIADLKGTPPPGSNPRLDDRASWHAQLLISLSGQAGHQARPQQADLLTRQLGAVHGRESRRILGFYYTRRIAGRSSHLADNAAMRNQTVGA